MPSIAILPFGAEELPFARQMPYEAAFWRPGLERPPLEEALERPDLAGDLDGGQPGDRGLIARVSDQPVGAVWVRRFDRDRHGYGYVDERTPELTLAVAAPYRRRGVARCLLTASITQQRLQGTARLSSSVEDDNPAPTLDKQLGFTVQHAEGGSRTMLRSLIDDGGSPSSRTAGHPAAQGSTRS